jgi:hypothetical protein
MKHVLTGVAVAALAAFAMSGPAQARMHHHHGHWHYGWYGPWGWGVHAPNDFVANRLNRAVLGQVGLTGASGLDRVALNPQPLPP